MGKEEATKEESKIVYNVEQVMEIIPQRYPFLMIDRVIELIDNHKIVAIKNVTMNEPFFMGHFPGRPVMPGAMIMEAMAQAGSILARVSKDGVDPSKQVFLVGLTDYKFKRMVVPGDTMRIEMFSLKKRRPLWFMSGSVYVDGKLCVSGTLSAAEN